jgi:opacity protein-like surface antigen
MNRFALLCGLVMLFAGAAAAQDENPKLEAFGGYSLIHNSSNFFGNTSITFNGGGGSISYNPKNWLGFVGDFGGNHWSKNGQDSNVVTYLFGPKIAFRSDKFTPFAQVLFGGAHISGLSSGCLLCQVNTLSENSFAMTLGGGLDYNVTKHIGIRPVQFEYLMTRFKATDSNSGPPQNSLRFEAGIVFRW